VGANLLADQELPGDGRLHDVPRLIEPGRALDELALGIQPEIAEDVEPDAELQVLAPRVEAAAAPVGFLDRGAETAVAAREHALEQRRFRVTILERHRLAVRRLPQHAEPAVQLRRPDLCGPGERRVRLGHVRRDAGGDAEVAVALVARALPRLL